MNCGTQTVVYSQTKQKSQRGISIYTVERRWEANFAENRTSGQKGIKLRHKTKQIMTRQINNCIKKVELKKKEGYELIKDNYRPNKVLQFEISLENLEIYCISIGDPTMRMFHLPRTWLVVIYPQSDKHRRSVCSITLLSKVCSQKSVSISLLSKARLQSQMIKF